jgi:aspartate oxidase
MDKARAYLWFAELLNKAIIVRASKGAQLGALKLFEPELVGRMRQAMGPVRDAGTLHTAPAATLTELEALGPECRVLRNRFGLAAAMLDAAAAREESRGAHWRTDFPRRHLQWDGPCAVYPRRLAPTPASTSDVC